MIRQTFLALCTLTFITINSALAHSVWLEPKGDQLVIRFAEPGDDFETSPGQLDNLSAPIGFILVTNAPASVDVTKKSDFFLLVGASPTNTACAETIFTVRGGRKPNFYARWQPADAGAGTPLLTLDLVPTGKPGEVRAYFRGQPLPGIKATIRTPDGKDTELTADAEGFLHFEPKQAGQYLLTVAHHREPLAGFYRGGAYKETSHNCSLVWQQK
ncbi:MAG: hypothetical protein WDM80_19050 [Limisphaerales bacterium]